MGCPLSGRELLIQEQSGEAFSTSNVREDLSWLTESSIPLVEKSQLVNTRRHAHKSLEDVVLMTETKQPPSLAQPFGSSSGSFD
jgi:hypothetical protein